jgi:dynein heavy chain
MGKFFKGLATAGAWACFDEFNRIDIEVLSVIAQQMLNIQNAIIQEKEVFEFEGSMIRLDTTTSTFITMNPGYAGRTELPDNLKALFRPMAMMVPDYALIAEIRLFSFGFDFPKPCAQKLVSTFRLSSEQLSSQDHYDFGMRAVNTVINTAGLLKSRDPEQNEDLTMLRAIRDSNLPKFLRDDILLFRAIIKDIFPGVQEPNAEYAELEAQIKAAVESDFKLQFVPDFLVKCIQLYEMTVVRHGMMLVGPTGGGKSRILRVLQAAMSRVENDPNFDKVRVLMMNPKSITMNQLYGSFDLQTGEWTDGIAAVLIRHMSSPDMEETGVTLVNLKWMVFDGPVDAIWIENMNTVLDDNKKLCLNSGEIIPLAETNRVIFEVEDLSVASPATVSRCGMIYVEPAYLLPSRLKPEKAAEAPLMKTWLMELPPPLDEHRETLARLMNIFVVPCTELLRLELAQPIAAPMPAVIANILRVLECYLFALLPDPSAEPDAEAMEAMKERLPKLVEPAFFMSLIWGVGGLVDQASRDKFDSFLREKMKEHNTKAGGMPASGSVFDCAYDMAEGRWLPWIKTTAEYQLSPKTDFKADFDALIIPTASSICYASLLNTLMSGNKHTLIIGPTGTAKSVTVSQYLTNGISARYEPIMMAFSAQTSANQTQDILDSKFEKRRQGQDKDSGLAYTMWGPMLGKRFLIFIDDFNMPKRETYGAQPPVELMRQMVDTAAYAPPGAPGFGGGWYDRKTLRWKSIVDVTLIAAMGPPGGGRQVMTNRMIRHMHLLNFTTMSNEVVEGIFSTITKAFLENDMAADLVPMAAPLVQATLGLYTRTCDVLRPMPSKPHYTFNLREISKVIQGLLMADKRRTVSREDLAHLWAHECQRVFADRLINEEDRHWFLEETKAQMKEHLKLAYEKVVDSSRPLLYCDFFTAGADPAIYEEVKSVDKLTEMCKEHQNEYNEQHLPMSLVLFEDALGHVCRISRVLRQPSGNALLLGVGGSGRQSLTRLAAHIADYRVYQIEITKSYRVIEWREDLKTVLKIAGYSMEPVVFLFVDTQISAEIFLENVNNILSSGEVPNLFEESDLGPIFEKMTQLLVSKGEPVTKTALYAQFVKLVKKNLHVAMCMSPLGGEYTDRIRQFPSLINNTTTDWFSPWPNSALKAVARTLMAEQADTMDEKIFTSIVDICGSMHSAVRDSSTRFLDEMRRHNYVTPTSYLELLSVIKMVLKQRQEKINTRRNQLSNGLDKLNKTKAEVFVLKQQLAGQQPILIETSAKVKEQQAQIAIDKKEALVIKAQAEASSAAAATKAAECTGIKESAEAGLAEALPALDAAVKCLSKLDKSQIVEVKALKKPPSGVRLVLQAVCIMFQIKSVKITDPDNPQKKLDDYWGPSQKMLNDLGPDKFKQALIDFDKDNIPDAVIKLVEPICISDEFQPEIIVKVSVACEAMCLWVQAMRKYYYVSKEVEPKRRQLAAAEVGGLDSTEARARERAAAELWLASAARLSVDEWHTKPGRARQMAVASARL